MPFKLKIFSIGKTKEQWLEEAFAEYTKRLQPTISVEEIWAKNDAHLIQLLSQKKEGVICLDPKGKELDSYSFANFLEQQFQNHFSQLSIIIGGSEGLPIILRKNKLLISLSKLTFTHQITRLILIEQVYRATQIWKNSPYHK